MFCMDGHSFLSHRPDLYFIHIWYEIYVYVEKTLSRLHTLVNGYLKFRTAFKPSSNILPRAVILRRRGNHDLRCLTLLKLKERSLYSAESEYSFVLTSTMTAIAIGFIMLRHAGIFTCWSGTVSGKRCYNIVANVKPGWFWGAEAVEEKAVEEKM